MKSIKKILKMKQTKVILTVIFVAAVLAAAFFLAPEGGNLDTSYADGQTTAYTLSTTQNEITEALTSAVQQTTTEITETQTTQMLTSNAVTEGKKESVTKDKYQTDSVPDGKPTPQEPEDVTIDQNKKMTCTLSIRCNTVLNNMDKLKKGKESVVPNSGIILKSTSVTFSEGENVFDVLKRVTREKGIHMQFKITPVYNSAYIQGINNLYEFDCGPLSGWMYKVNGWFPNYGCSRYTLSDGDKIEWVYTCDLGTDVGGSYASGQK